MSIAPIIDDLIEREGEFSDHPADKGGPTRWGITEAVARASGYAGDMRNLPRQYAEAIYMRRYINGPGFNRVMGVSMRIAEEMIDTGVNMGGSLPGPWLQRILNVLNQQARTSLTWLSTASLVRPRLAPCGPWSAGAARMPRRSSSGH